MIELKLGRPCIGSDDNNLDRVKGLYIHTNDMGVHCLLNAKNHLQYFSHVKPDPDAPPMNGDEVEYTPIETKLWFRGGKYIGRTSEGLHIVEDSNRDVMICFSVRHPQPESKRERIKELIANHEAGDNLIAEILKICEVEE